LDLDRIIRGGTVVTAGDVFRADVGIRGEQVVALADRVSADGADIIDAEGMLVLPGGVDVHTHLDSESGGDRTADDFYSGTVAAVCGGITTICDYAHQAPGQSIEKALAIWKEKAAGRAVIDYGFHVIVSDVSGEVLSEIARLITSGYPSYKTFFLNELKLDDNAFLALLDTAAAAGGIVNVHAEDGVLLDHAVQRLRRQGHLDLTYFAQSRPAEAEVAGTQHAIAYAEYTGACVYIVHVSAAGAAEAIRDARSRGVRVWGETRPIYLVLTDNCYASGGMAAAKMTGAPPIRSAEHRSALWRGLQAGYLSAIGSDHTTWTPEQKADAADDFTRVRFGVPGLETELPVIFSEGVASGRLPLTRFVDIISTTPARLFGLYPRKGTIAVGSDADIVVLDPERRVVIDERKLHTRAGYDPFHGKDITGWPVTTLARGEVVAHEGEFLGRQGRGRLIERTPMYRDTHTAAAK
jgi:dihydropyrimidinase